MKDIDPRALEIVQRLQRRGFECYLVGGCVRDLLAGVKPKDFDIATNAQPMEIKRTINYCIIIGRRFKLVLARRGDQQFEVATFRRQMSDEELQSAKSAVDLGDEAVVGDNFFGTVKEDAQRRDFTINGLFYDPSKDEILDYVDGLKDVASRTIRMIGDSESRLREDPIRILRALRLSHKLNFRLAPELRLAIVTSAAAMKNAILPRKREEYLKIMKLDDPVKVFVEMYDLGILQQILPSFCPIMEDPEKLHTFSTLIHDSRGVGFDMNSPVENLTLLLYIYFRSVASDLNFEELLVHIQKDESLSMMKDELGIFRSEAQHFTLCLESYPSFCNVDRYQKKGERRKLAFLHQDQIPLAYRLFYLDQVLDPSASMFWFHELRKNKILD